jgi:hypothetical protein
MSEKTMMIKNKIFVLFDTKWSKSKSKIPDIHTIITVAMKIIKIELLLFFNENSAAT